MAPGRGADLLKYRLTDAYVYVIIRGMDTTADTISVGDTVNILHSVRWGGFTGRVTDDYGDGTYTVKIGREYVMFDLNQLRVSHS